MTELSLNDGCTKKEAPESEEPAGDDKVETVIPSYVGIWRRNVSPWDKDAESDVDTFLELMPTGKAVLHEVAKVGDARSIRAQGPYTLPEMATSPSHSAVLVSTSISDAQLRASN